ncbi:putative Misato 1-like protein, partial [Naja naja]
KPQQLGKPLVPERLAPAWTDFLRTKLHPRTILTIHEYNREDLGQSTRSGTSWGLCATTKRTLGRWGSDGPFFPSRQLPHRNFYRLMNTALGIVRLSSQSSLFCPLSLNGSLGLKPGGPVALPYLQYEVAEASAALPFSVAKDQSLPDALYNQQPSAAWCPLSSCGDQSDASCFAQSVVLRGIGKRQQVSTSLLLQGPCKLLAPYPQFFSPFLNKYGFLLEKPLYCPAKVESIPILAAFRSSAGLYRTLDDFCRELRGTDLRRWASFFSAGVEMDDFREALDELRTLSLCYKKSSLDENSDDDTD